MSVINSERFKFIRRIELVTLVNPRLQMVFNSQFDELQKAFKDLAETLEPKMFKYEVMLAFWLSIEMEKDDIAQMILEIDPLLARVILNLRENGYTMRKA